MSLPRKKKECKVAFLGDHLSFWEEGERKTRKDGHRKSGLREKKEESVVSLDCKAKENFKETGGEDQRGIKKSEDLRPSDAVIKRSL